MRPVFYQRKLHPNYGISRRQLIRLVLIGLGIFLIYKAAIFGKSIVDSFRAIYHAEVAEDLFKKNDIIAAEARLKTAINLDSTNVKASRLMARILDRENLRQAVLYHRVVLQSGEATLDDYECMARSAAIHDDEAMARFAATKAAELSGDTSFPHIIEAMVHGSAGNRPEQEKSLRTALAQKETPETLGLLAKFLQEEKEIIDLYAAEIAGLLRKIAVLDNGPDGLQALRTGLSAKLVPADELLGWIGLYRNHSAATIDSRLDSFAAEYALPNQTAPVVTSDLLEHFRRESLDVRLRVANWLLERNESEAAVRLLPTNEIASHREAFEVWLEAAMKQERWSEIIAALESPSNPLPPQKRMVALATVRKKSGDVAGGDALYREALSKYAGQKKESIEILKQFIAADEWELFEKSFTQLLNDPDFSQQDLKGFIPVVRAHRDSEKMLRFYELVLRSRFHGQDPFILDRLHFTRLVLGKTVPIEEIEFRLNESVETPAYRLTAGLGMLKSDRKAKALFLIENAGEPLAASDLLPHEQAVLASILAANGRVEEAVAIAAAIPRRKLTVQEEALLKISPQP